MTRTMMCLLAGLMLVSWTAAVPRTLAQEDVADVPAESVLIGQDEHKRYVLIGPAEGAAAPEVGYGLLVVLPGGDGSESFTPFVKRIWKNALPDGYLIAQPVAVKWTPEQPVVWPTAKLPMPKQEFTTEEFVEAVAADVGQRHKLDPKRVFVLGWSSGGPAAYAVSLQERATVRGAFVAMSVFKPELLPSLKRAKGRPFFVYHSPDDDVCPFRMAKSAEVLLGFNGAKVKLAEYEGGHGWRGDVYGAIRGGVEWLAQASEQVEQPDEEAAPPAATQGIPLADSFESGRDAPEGWWRGARIPGVQYIWDRQTASDGQSSLCLKKTAQRFFPIAQWRRAVPHEPGRGRLRVSAQVKAQRAAKAIIDVQFLDSAGQSAGHEWAVYIGAKGAGDPPADHDWQQYEGVVDVPPGTAQIGIGLQIYGPGTIWFDELTLSYPGE